MASDRRDSTFQFLVLAPVQSATYAASSAASTPATEVATPDVAPVHKERRSSSVSSGELLAKRRVLKLSPVHGGQQGSSDFVDLDEE